MPAPVPPPPQGKVDAASILASTRTPSTVMEPRSSGVVLGRPAVADDTWLLAERKEQARVRTSEFNKLRAMRPPAVSIEDAGLSPAFQKWLVVAVLVVLVVGYCYLMIAKRESVAVLSVPSSEVRSPALVVVPAAAKASSGTASGASSGAVKSEYSETSVTYAPQATSAPVAAPGQAPSSGPASAPAAPATAPSVSYGGRSAPAYSSGSAVSGVGDGTGKLAMAQRPLAVRRENNKRAGLITKRARGRNAGKAAAKDFVEAVEKMTAEHFFQKNQALEKFSHGLSDQETANMFKQAKVQLEEQD